jgi:hypothetical protein
MMTYIYEIWKYMIIRFGSMTSSAFGPEYVDSKDVVYEDESIDNISSGDEHEQLAK